MRPITVIGSINVDHVIRVPYFPLPGETLTGQGYQQFSGGKGANQAVAVARSGAPCRFLACAGDDAVGLQLLEDYKQQGIDISTITRVEGCTTGVAMIQVNDAGENTIAIASGANAALSQSIVEAHLEEPQAGDWLVVSLETPLPPLLFAVERWRAAGGKVLLNPAPAQSLSDSFLRHVDLITPNETEAKILTGITVAQPGDANKAAQALHDRGIPLVIITLGSQGVWLSCEGGGELLPAFSVTPVDTTAAGDTFNGYLVSSLNRGRSLVEAAQLAQRAAAVSVTRSGAQSSIPWAKEL